MSCPHSIFGCERCRFVGNMPQEAIEARVPSIQSAPLPENRATVTMLQQMFEAERAEVRRLIAELAKREVEVEGLRAELAEAKRKARRRSKR